MSSPDPNTAVVVFTRDLRVRDNPALVTACRHDRVVPLFVLDDVLVSTSASNRLGFLVDSLRDLDVALRRLGAPLVVRRGDWVDEVMAVAARSGATAIHLADDVSSFAARRLERLSAAAGRAGVSVHVHPGVTVVPAGRLRPGSGAACYEVFTPYYRAWSRTPWRSVVAPPSGLQAPDTESLGGIEVLDSLPLGGRSPHVMAGGETAGLERLIAFERSQLQGYEEGHDALADDATSRLSAFLHFGCLSPLGIATRLEALPGGAAYVRQLCWRDFFHQVLAARPQSAWADHRDRGHRWNVDPDGYEAWCNARTGYPLVDAAMRQLADEGFVHNRARLVVASFLTKDLYVDWRLGAAHFMSLLVDGDVANNQLNWQWVAGTGTDYNPSRVFNPVLQGRRFDPGGEYIRRYVPELAGLGAAEIHWPDRETRQPLGYPEPIVDHREAIEEYQARLRRPPAR